MSFRWTCLLGVCCTAAFLAAGCSSSPKPDLNPHVFQTPEQVARQRQAAQIRQWRTLAIDILHERRPDLHASPGGDFGLMIHADPINRGVDLSPLLPRLFGQSEQSHKIISAALEGELRKLDQDRLAVVGFEAARPRLQPRLIGARELSELTSRMGGDLHATPVAGDLYWIPVIVWGESADPTLEQPYAPVLSMVIEAWAVETETVDQAAMDNLRSALNSVEGELFDTTTFGTVGRVGELRPGVNAAVILTSRFRRAVQQAWETEENLVVLLSSRRQLRFTEEGNQRLLLMLVPQWQRAVGEVPYPLSTRPLVMGETGFGIWTAPLEEEPEEEEEPAPAPPPYIVR